MMSLPYVFPRLLLLAFLMLPFLLRETSSRWEPYPAVLLPVGDGLLDVRSPDVRFERTEVAAVLENGREVELDMEALLSPIPSQYWEDIVRHRFGLQRDQRDRTRTARFGIWSISVGRIDRPTDRETLAWLHGRLAERDIHDARAIRIRRVDVTYGLDGRSQVGRTVREHYDIDLAY